MSSTLLSRLRALPRVVGWVLASYLLVVMAASAAPWASPPSVYAALCSASGAAGEDPQDGSLDCVLCLPQQVGAAPEHAFAALAPLSHVAPAARTDSLFAQRRAALPPARGPPSV